MKRNIPGRIAESLLLGVGWFIAVGCCVSYLVGSITRDCARSFITIWREN